MQLPCDDRRRPQRKDVEVICLPIKTLHITNCYHASSGGIRTFYHALLDAANQRRREIRLVVPGPKDSIEEVGEFARIYTIAAPVSPFVDSKYRLLLPHLYALPYRSKLRQILEEERPGLVEVCDKYTLCFLPSVLRRGWIESASSRACGIKLRTDGRQRFGVHQHQRARAPLCELVHARNLRT